MVESGSPSPAARSNDLLRSVGGFLEWVASIGCLVWIVLSPFVFLTAKSSTTVATDRWRNVAVHTAAHVEGGVATYLGRYELDERTVYADIDPALWPEAVDGETFTAFGTTDGELSHHSPAGAWTLNVWERRGFYATVLAAAGALVAMAVRIGHRANRKARLRREMLFEGVDPTPRRTPRPALDMTPLFTSE